MSAPIRALLMDDEPLALNRLARLLEATGRVQIVGRTTDPQKGLKQVAAQTVDVVFLDIHMPGLGGFQVVERLPAGPLVVFTTAYDQHAVQAFEVNAVDYLLKPIDRERLAQALDRVEQRREDPARHESDAALLRLAKYLRATPFIEHLASRMGERVQLVPVTRVTHVVARDRATYAVTATAEHVLDATIAELEHKLDPMVFFRIHRGILVNVAWVGELHAGLGGQLFVRLKDDRKTELVVARDRARAFKERLGV